MNVVVPARVFTENMPGLRRSITMRLASMLAESAFILLALCLSSWIHDEALMRRAIRSKVSGATALFS
jgi:hypothetical protein